MSLQKTQYKTDIQLLLDIHSYSRSHNSTGEWQFIERFIDCVPGMESDGFGNRHLTIPGAPHILFSCHTDTVHSPKAKPRQKVKIKGGLLQLAKPANGYCLGADDGAGVFLMLEMIRAAIPGTYIFHRAEESGGHGSHYIATTTPSVLADIEIAIAFDRKGTCDIITHQGQRTASDRFADTLADAIGLPGLIGDPTGLFTDTANYSSLVSECTNISVGYENQHSKNETLDIAFLLTLRDALFSTPWDTLASYRDPNALDLADDFPPNTYYNEPDLTDLIAEYPELAATAMEAYGLTLEDFRAEIFATYGEYN